MRAIKTGENAPVFDLWDLEIAACAAIFFARMAGSHTII
jgi:hypothetical protein